MQTGRTGSSSCVLLRQWTARTLADGSVLAFVAAPRRRALLRPARLSLGLGPLRLVRPEAPEDLVLERLGGVLPGALDHLGRLVVHLLAAQVAAEAVPGGSADVREA